MVVKNQASAVPCDVFDVINSMIRTVSAQASQVVITPDTLLIDDLALDSLDIVRVIMLLEDRYHVEIDLDEVPKMRKVRDFALTVSGQTLSAA
jgi:acyl carrier protein